MPKGTPEGAKRNTSSGGSSGARGSSGSAASGGRTSSNYPNYPRSMGKAQRKTVNAQAWRGEIYVTKSEAKRTGFDGTGGWNLPKPVRKANKYLDRYTGSGKVPTAKPSSSGKAIGVKKSNNSKAMSNKMRGMK